MSEGRNTMDVNKRGSKRTSTLMEIEWVREGWATSNNLPPEVRR